MAEMPLSGWRVVVTRAEGQADKLSDHLRRAGAEPVAYPTIAFAPPEDMQLLDDALRQLLSGGYNWLILTSVTGVRAVRERLDVMGGALAGNAAADGAQVAVVGSATAAACVEMLGVQPAVVPDKFVAEALVEALRDMQGQRVLLAQAELARSVLRERLQQAGALVDAVIAYRTVPASGGVDLPAMLEAGQIDAITFTSSSTVRFFVQRLGPAALEHARRTVIASIGPIAAQTAEEMGLPPAVVAEPSTVEGLVAALVAWRHNT
jgi:uroporphyrinogen-III synthase